MQADNAASKNTAAVARSDEQQGSTPSTALVSAAGPHRLLPLSRSPIACSFHRSQPVHAQWRPSAALALLVDAPVDRAPRVGPMR